MPDGCIVGRRAVMGGIATVVAGGAAEASSPRGQQEDQALTLLIQALGRMDGREWSGQIDRRNGFVLIVAEPSKPAG